MIDYIPLTVAAGKRMTTAELRHLATERMRAHGFPVVAQELAVDGCRFDVIGLGRWTRQVRIYEVKSSRADWLADGKWERYLPFATHFAFVCPAGAIAPWELPPGVGLVEYGSPALERMLRNRRFGFTVGRDDALRAARPARRLRDAVADAEWIALLEAVAFAGTATPPEPPFTDGAGI